MGVVLLGGGGGKLVRFGGGGGLDLGSSSSAGGGKKGAGGVALVGAGLSDFSWWWWWWRWWCLCSFLSSPASDVSPDEVGGGWVETSGGGITAGGGSGLGIGVLLISWRILFFFEINSVYVLSYTFTYSDNWFMNLVNGVLYFNNSSISIYN